MGGCNDTSWSSEGPRGVPHRPPVLARQRQAYILDRVREDGGVRVAELVRDLGVSDMTIRRDMELLHERGLIEKVHGGATALPGSALFEPGFAAKSALQQAEKEAIVDAANDWQPDLIGMPTAGHRGFLDALRGSTTERVLRQTPCPLLAVPV